MSPLEFSQQEIRAEVEPAIVRSIYDLSRTAGELLTNLDNSSMPIGGFGSHGIAYALSANSA
jgi:hypothetical protein